MCLCNVSDGRQISMHGGQRCGATGSGAGRACGAQGACASRRARSAARAHAPAVATATRSSLARRLVISFVEHKDTLVITFLTLLFLSFLLVMLQRSRSTA